jgi:prolyl-tRNA editing enzyme YbaK/EbsC (Cys-tRNA(Pro) deacylase)
MKRSWRLQRVVRSVRESMQMQSEKRPDLLQYDEVWAAAGTWNDVFGIEPHKLVEASGGAVTDLKRV